MNNKQTNVYPFDLLDVPGAFNVRDIGGYAGRDGRPVNKRRFLRSGGLHTLPPQGVEAVRALGVSRIVDLRSRYEAEKMPDTLREDGAVDYVHIPMLDYIQSNLAEGGVNQFPDSMAEMYIGLLDSGKDKFLHLMQVFADPAHRTILFHCTAGKDRTGLTAMLLLGLAGVSREDIIADYIPSGELGPPAEPQEGLPRHIFESTRDTMEAALDHLEARYGGIAGYLSHIGLDRQTEALLLQKLLGD